MKHVTIYGETIEQHHITHLNANCANAVLLVAKALFSGKFKGKSISSALVRADMSDYLQTHLGSGSWVEDMRDNGQ